MKIDIYEKKNRYIAVPAKAEPPEGWQTAVWSKSIELDPADIKISLHDPELTLFNLQTRGWSTLDEGY